MKDQHIECLEKVLNLKGKESSLNLLIKPQSILYDKQNMLQEIMDPLMKFQKDFTNLREKQLKQISRNLSQILGYGQGSTPASDDIFLGILAAKYCLNKEVGEEFEYLAKVPFESFTTSESAKIIRGFLIWNFPTEIIPFLELLKQELEHNQVKFQFEQESRKIKTLGTTSGYYFLLGVLWELKYNEKAFILT